MTVKARHPLFALVLLAMAQFMVVLDATIVNVALPTIERSLHFTQANLQWVVTGYTLTFGGFLLLGGRAADLLGRRLVFMIGVIVFALASLGGGLSQSDTMLIFFRGLQGLAAAFLSPAALSIVLTTFEEGQDRNRALGVWGGVAAGGGAAGVLLGGILTQYVGWQWVFFVNVPIGLLVAALALPLIVETKAELEHRNFDITGAVTSTAGLVLLVYGLVKAPEAGWGSLQTILTLAISLLILAFFIFNEHRSKHPLMPLSIFRIGNVAAANVAQLPIIAGMFAMFFFLALYIQQVLGYSPVRTGFSYLPITFAIGLSAGIASRLVLRIGFKPIMTIAPLFVAAALILLSRVPVHGHYFHDLFPAMMVFALAMGSLFVTIAIAATNGVPGKDSGLVSGLLNTTQQVGGSLGLAILSVVAASTTRSSLAVSGGSPAAVPQALVDGFHIAFIYAAAFAAISSVVAFTFIRQHGRLKAEDVQLVPGVGVSEADRDLAADSGQKKAHEVGPE